MKMKKSIGSAALMWVLLGSLAHADTLVNARYETVQCTLPCQADAAKHMHWWLMRDQDAVEIRNVYQNDEPSHHSSLWQKKPGGQFSYIYLMHEERRAIDYADVDLKLLSIKMDESSWQIKTQLVTDSELGSLQKLDTQETLQYGHVVEKYSGVLGDGIRTQVWWMPELKLPYKVEYIYPQHSVTIQLTLLQHPDDAQTADASAPKTAMAVIEQYQHVDYTDLGDMEHNPSEMQWLAKAHDAPGLNPHMH